jgi:cyclophilin family peptidyl-prolyl cis-trans isomerase/HEAT repeat protein
VVAPALVWAVAACAGFAGRSSRTTVRPLDADEQVALARVLQAADARREDTAAFEAALRSRSTVVRAAAARALGQIHVDDAARRLRALLKDADTAVAANAAFALGLVRDSTAATVEALAAALDGSPSVASEAAWALGEIGPPAGAAVERGLGSPHDGAVTEELLHAAGRLRPAPLSTIVPFLSASDPALARAAAYAIARPRLAAGVRAIVPLASSRDPLTRSYVARGLASEAAGDSLAGQAVAALSRLAADSDPHVRVAAVYSLGGYGPQARAPLLTAVRDSNANVRVAAAQSLASVLGPRRRDWAELWSVDTGFMFRRSLVASAVRAGVILEAIDEDNPDNWQRSPDWRYRASVAEAADGTPVERVREVALPLTRDHDGRVRTAAYAAFAPYADSADAAAHPWRREVLLSALHDEDCYVRAIVLAALAGQARASEVPSVVQAYRLALSDSADDARAAAVAYLASAWRADSAHFNDSIRAAVRELPPSRDPSVLIATAGSPILEHWGPAPGTGRSLDWYEGIVRSVVAPTAAGSPLHADIVTDRGSITLELFALDAPLTVYNFMSLARAGFYGDTRFHRVVPGFVAQDGDPRGDGNGGPGHTIRDELNRRRYDRGTVGMALSGPDTGGSQYFLTLSPQPHLDGHYAAFGRVVAGLDVMDALVQGDRIKEVDVR